MRAQYLAWAGVRDLWRGGAWLRASPCWRFAERRAGSRPTAHLIHRRARSMRLPVAQAGMWMRAFKIRRSPRAGLALWERGARAVVRGRSRRKGAQQELAALRVRSPREERRVKVDRRDPPAKAVPPRTAVQPGKGARQAQAESRALEEPLAALADRLCPNAKSELATQRATAASPQTARSRAAPARRIRSARRSSTASITTIAGTRTSAAGRSRA